MEGIQEDEVQIVVNRLCVLEPTGLEIGKDAIQTLGILNDLKKTQMLQLAPKSSNGNVGLLFTPRSIQAGRLCPLDLGTFPQASVLREGLLASCRE